MPDCTATLGAPNRTPIRVPVGVSAPRGIDRAVQREPAVALEDLPGDPLHGVQGLDRLGDVGGLAQAAQRRAAATPASHGDPSTVVAGPRPSIGVRVTPGATALTRMPESPHSSAAAWTSMESAAFEAE